MTFNSLEDFVSKNIYTEILLDEEDVFYIDDYRMRVTSLLHKNDRKFYFYHVTSNDLSLNEIKIITHLGIINIKHFLKIIGIENYKLYGYDCPDFDSLVDLTKFVKEMYNLLEMKNRTIGSNTIVN